MSTVLKTEPMGFQQNMHIERGYQIVISDFGIFESLKSGKIIIFCFSKFPKNTFEFSNRNICDRALVDKYTYTIFSLYLEERLSFTVLDA